MIEKLRLDERLDGWALEYCKINLPPLNALNPLQEMIDCGVLTRTGEAINHGTPADEIQQIIDDMVRIGGDLWKAAIVLHVEKMARRETIKTKLSMVRKRGLGGVGRSKYFELLGKAKIYIMARLQERSK